VLDHPWITLGIEPTLDEIEIRRAYARRLRLFRPDEDPRGFQRLAAARDAALTWRGPLPNAAVRPELSEGGSQGNQEEPDRRSEIGPARSVVDLVQRPKFVDVPYESAGEREPPEPIELEQAAPKPLDEREPLSVPRTLDLKSECAALLDKLLGWDSIRQERLEVNWDVKAWEPLLALIDELDLIARDEVREIIARGLFLRLPNKANIPSTILADVRHGSGAAALVERLDAELHFSEDQARFALACGRSALDKYMSWLAAIKGARAAVARAEAGSKSYWDQNGLPLFPADDRSDALPQKYLERWLTMSRVKGRKLWSFDARTLWVPTARAMQAGLSPLAAIFVAASVLWLAFVPLSTSKDLIIAGSAFLALLTPRFLAAVFMPRLATFAAITKVRKADRKALPPSLVRSQSVRPFQDGFAFWIAGVLDLILAFAIVFVVIYQGGPTFRLRSFEHTPAEVVWSNFVVSVLEKTAYDDSISTPNFVGVYDGLIHAREKLQPRRAADLLATAMDHNILLEQAGSVDQFIQKLGDSKTLINAVAREQKLTALTESYRAATPEDREKLENMIAQWLGLLQSAPEPEDEAAIWAAIPPRTDGAALQHYPYVSRNLALRNVLRSSKGFNDFAFSLSRYALASDKAFFDLPPNFLVNVVQAAKNDLRDPSLGPNEPADYFKQALGRRLPLADDATFEDGNSNSLALRAFREIADSCLATLNSQSRQAIQDVLIRAIRQAPEALSPTPASYWRDQTRELMADRVCFERVTMKKSDFRSLKIASDGVAPILYGFDRDENEENVTIKTMLDAAQRARNDGRKDQAMALYDRVIDMPLSDKDTSFDPVITDHPLRIAYAYRASIELGQSKLNAALSDIDHAFRFFAAGPKKSEMLMLRARALLGLGQSARAMHDLDGAVATDPSADSYSLRADVELILGQRDKAIADYRSALKIAPNADGPRQTLHRLNVTQ
jgi:tetratricopeptide (TPR) repeat protein